MSKGETGVPGGSRSCPRTRRASQDRAGDTVPGPGPLPLVIGLWGRKAALGGSLNPSLMKLGVPGLFFI